ncbi:hypothetical protein [Intestinibacillus sp. Marseille-P6563]|uniref:hypothetical protein n=1 Tax=Intestinibacillus sp. Marseille-P6563 TaxID=2364792 RepID=UPI000F070F76|nr:hypothetical protein [Intestinibacillus sp. Marseille-P6563]
MRYFLCYIVRILLQFQPFHPYKVLLGVNSLFERNMSWYYLTRVDLCTNIHCDRQDVFQKLVRLLRKTATPKKYERKHYQNPDKKGQSVQQALHPHRLWFAGVGDLRQDIPVNLTVAYKELPSGVLRIEIHYGRDKLRHIEKKHNRDDSCALLERLMKQNKD